MAQPTPFALSKLFTELIGRKVSFTQTTPPVDTKVKLMYGIYTVLPQESAIVVKADLPLLGSFAGVLVGLPDSAVKERLAVSPTDELLRDAIYEVLNIASAVITEDGRAIFKQMVTDAAYIDGEAGKVLKKPDHRSYFNVTVDGHQGGKFTILAPFAPVKA